MRISRIYIENFRNFKKLDVKLDSHAVIVGENKIGKSNLLHALRLLLDPTLPDSARQLRDEDFWDGLHRPLTKNDRITISVEIADYEKNPNQLSLLAEHLISSEPMVSRLTYVFQPKATVTGNPQKESDYEFFIYGGDDPEKRVNYDVRRRLPLDLLPALRDAEGDLANWRRSPLKPLLNEAANNIDKDKLKDIAKKVSDATDDVRKLPDIKELSKQLSERLKNMVGNSHAIELALGFSPTDPERLLRALRLFIDAGKRGIGEASLGSANLLYIVLKVIELEQLIRQNSRDHTIWAIEEPEAHLHPHLQRLVYGNFLRSRSKEKDDVEKTTTILMTTHSPHIVSVAPLKTLMIIRKTSDGKSSEGVSAASIALDEKETADLERYIDVTRGEILFAKGVLLVEGDAEEFLLPVLGEKLDYDFDKLGITVCSVSGTNFLPYVKLLGQNGLNIPYAVITDFDPQGDGAGLGQKRIINLLSNVMDAAEYAKYKEDALLKTAPKYGFFTAEYCLEIDLFKSGQHKSMCQTMIELTESGAADKRAKEWMDNPDKLDESLLQKDITAISKGRFAQRLAANITSKACPDYIKKAIKYVADKCQ